MVSPRERKMLRLMVMEEWRNGAKLRFPDAVSLE
jgi:hypothetical protein